jgi:hypothetical protein
LCNRADRHNEVHPGTTPFGYKDFFLNSLPEAGGFGFDGVQAGTQKGTNVSSGVAGLRGKALRRGLLRKRQFGTRNDGAAGIG